MDYIMEILVLLASLENSFRIQWLWVGLAIISKSRNHVLIEPSILLCQDITVWLPVYTSSIPSTMRGISFHLVLRSPKITGNHEEV